MLKLLTALTILACATLTGFYFADKLRRRRVFLHDFIAFLSLLKTRIRYDCSDIKTLIIQCADSPALEAFRSKSFSENVSSVKEAWEGAVLKCSREFSLTDEDMTLLCDFGAGLGTSDLQGQLEHIELYEILVRKRLENAEQSCAQNGKLYRMLGFFAGTVAAIMII